MDSRRKTNRRFLVLVLVCCLPLLGSAVHQGYRIFRIHQESVRTEKKVQQLKAENDALAQEKENLGDIRYIEKVARVCCTERAAHPSFLSAAKGKRL